MLVMDLIRQAVHNLPCSGTHVIKRDEHCPDGREVLILAPVWVTYYNDSDTTPALFRSWSSYVQPNIFFRTSIS